MLLKPLVPPPALRSQRPAATARLASENDRVVRALGALTLAIGLVACSEEVIEQTEAVRPVKIHEIGALDEQTKREYPGSIRAYQHADMGFEVDGRITEFLVTEGEFVEQNAVLARLDDRDYRAALEASEADLRKAESDLTRSLSIFEQDSGAISQETIDTHQRAVDVAVARLKVSEKAVEDTELRAPFAGRMARKLVEDFQNVQAKEPVLVLQDTSILEIEIDVPERDVAQATSNKSNEELTESINPEIIVSAVPDRSFPGWVKEYATTADPVTRTFAVRLNFDNPGGINILPGMTARVRIVTNPERAWSVPVGTAQGGDTGEAFVWKVDPDNMTVSRANVELGDVMDERVQIVGGLETGDLVAVSGVARLRDGMQVRPYER